MNERIKITDTVKESVWAFEDAVEEGFVGLVKVYYIGGTPERINNGLAHLRSQGLPVRVTACNEVKEGCILFQLQLPSQFHHVPKDSLENTVWYA